MLQHGTNESYGTWAAALTSSACIGFTSLVPWLFNLTFFEHRKQEGNSLLKPDENNENGKQSSTVKDCGQQKDNYEQDGLMKFLLSFALGAILGDIFFHLLPESQESYEKELNLGPDVASKQVGLAIISGIFLFFIVEMMIEQWSTSMQSDNKSTARRTMEIEDQTDRKSSINNNSSIDNQRSSIFNTIDLNKSFLAPLSRPEKSTINDLLNNNNNNNNNDLMITNLNAISTKLNVVSDKLLKRNAFDASKDDKKNLIKYAKEQQQPFSPDINYHQIIDVAGYLSLIANGLDNFTHGLAIGASFLAGTKVGLLTTFVIFIHEIPHEICDYAILVNSGFSRLEAVKAQSSVSLFGILGTATALYFKSVKALTAYTLWILPFSAGGFLHIALVNLLPKILDRNTDILNSIGQIACVILGISFMAVVAIL